MQKRPAKRTSRRAVPTVLSESNRERRPTIDSIRALVAFADEGNSVSAAARVLESHQPVVSLKLKAFQGADAAAGAILLERDANGRGLRLTDAGLAVLPAMRELVRHYDQLVVHLREGSESPVLLKLAVGAFSAERFVPPALAALRRASGDDARCIVKTNVVRGRDRILGVANGHFDLAIVSHSPEQIAETLRDAGISQTLEISPMAGLSLIVAAGKRTPEGRRLASVPDDRPVSLKLLEQFELVGPEATSGIRRQLEQAAGPAVRLTFSIEGGGWSAAREFARFGLGVAIIPSVCLDQSVASHFVSRRIDAGIQLHHSLIHRGQSASQPALALLRKVLLAETQMIATGSC